MKSEYDIANMKRHPNPYSQQLKQQVTLSLGSDIIEYFYKKGNCSPQEKSIIEKHDKQDKLSPKKYKPYCLA